MTGLPRPASSIADAPPLCVDLDGTLVHCDLLHEAALRMVGRRPAAVARMFASALRGRQHLKHFVAANVPLDATLLPYRRDLLDYLVAEKAAGRRLVLVTASPRAWAEAVAAHLGIFDEVHATELQNLKGAHKAQKLVQLFPDGFDYVGDSVADRPVWQAARHSLRAGRGTAVAGPGGGVSYRDFPNGGSSWRAMLRLCRPHQWLKNLLVFVPLLAAHALQDESVLARALCCFVSFSLAASATYIVNDLLDIDADRAHPRKRFRPLAAGAVSVPAGLAMSILLFGLAVSTSFAVGSGLYIVLLSYIAMTMLYSLVVKRLVLVDVFCLAMLYSVRVVAGAVATHVALSLWLIGFSIFLFLALALVKRCAELAIHPASASDMRLAGRGYLRSDLPFLQMLSASSSFAAVVVFTLYAAQPEVGKLYKSPELLWVVAPLLLFWLCRVMLLTHRGRMHDDPIIFTAKDPKSLLLIGLAGAVVVLASVADLQLSLIAYR